MGGSLDYIDDSNIPQDQFVGDAYQSDFPDRNSQRESLVNGWITFSPDDPQLKDNVELRKSLSRAIDRDLIIKQIFSNTRTAATGWVSPGVDGYKADVCGDSCKFDAAAAKADFEAAGGYKGTLTMTYNADSPNKAWSEAVCNSIKNTLGVDCVAVPTVDFATLLNKLDAGEVKGIFRSAWQADYPSIENFLTPIYAKGAFPPKAPTTPSTTTRSSRGSWPRRQRPRRWMRPTPCTSRPRRSWPGLPDRSALVQQDHAAWSDGSPTSRSTPSGPGHLGHQGQVASRKTCMTVWARRRTSGGPPLSCGEQSSADSHERRVRWASTSFDVCCR